MATLDLPLPTSQSPQIQIERKNAAPRISRPRKRTNTLLTKGHKADDMLPKLGERFTSGPQLKVELLEKFPSVKPHSFNASNCHYSDRKRAGSTYFDGVVLGGRNS
jgi:hypothetical protein